MNHLGLWHGGDYYPEQWLNEPQILEEDLKLMKQAGINTVTLGVFSWSFLEPEEGEYKLSWLIDRVNLLYENGISVIMATPSAARPKWLADRYPEVLRVNEEGVRQLFGGRHNHCYTSNVYREKIRVINQKLATTFSAHPGILMWHISNEYGGECHCPLCQEAFRKWLEKRYDTIENLNMRWCTAFWSHVYLSFDQVESPSTIGENMVHGLNLDWKRFVTEQTADFVRWEIKALKDAGAMQPVTTNFMYDYKGLNYKKLSKEIDVVSWDSYPLWHKNKEILTARDNGMQHDYMRSLKKKPFLLMESCPSSTNWQGVSKLKKPGMLELNSLHAVSHGSDSVLYFQIRQSKGSSEKFHGAVIDHYGGEDTRVYQEVCHIGESLDGLKELAGTEVKSKVALIYDIENRWAMEDAQGPRNKGLYYKEAAVKIYSAMKKLGLNVDVISMEDSLTGYDLVAAPMLYLFHSGIEDKFRKFVNEGGKLMLTYWSGIVDEWDSCFSGGVPHDLMDVVGLRSTEIDGLYDGEYNHMIPKSGGMEEIRYECNHLCDIVSLKGAEVLATYKDDFYHGYPALTKNRYGKGVAYYVCADGEQKFYDDFLREVIKANGIVPLVKGEIPEDVEVCSRHSDQHQYLFFQNFNREPVKLVPEMIDEIKNGTLIFGELREHGVIGGYQTLVIKREN
ncbi:beta-galactosidase [Lacrimispora algidixylanolytica]|uniref:Beta-galactosidase n=1 Tax=Lacrimispora algidixylanolytica TaxID=94868 RepID=A0A419T041_9FIRM|nr:beta-galactosidase [Lacrimispora algidixylanolytica]RKD30798.1 beta-galactosidase [Lacrimispora algidixylanolytica]